MHLVRDRLLQQWMFKVGYPKRNYYFKVQFTHAQFASLNSVQRQSPKKGVFKNNWPPKLLYQNLRDLMVSAELKPKTAIKYKNC